MQKVNTNYYDKSDYYDEFLEPLVREIKVRCSAEKIPMFISVAVANDKNGTSYNNDVVFGTTEIHLTDNRIGKMLLSINDFDTEIPDKIRREIQDIQDYLDRIQAKKEPHVNRKLTDNQIDDLNRIGNGGDGISVIPKERQVDTDVDFETEPTPEMPDVDASQFDT